MSLKQHKKCGPFDRWYIPQVSFVLVAHSSYLTTKKIDLFLVSLVYMNENKTKSLMIEL
jgi:hypothetical protein